MSKGLVTHLRCFIEGVEIPIVSCSVSAAIGGPASAHIELLDSEKGFELLPRSIIHVFFFDNKDGANTASPTYTADSKKSSRRSRHYKLLFCGELFSIFHNKSGYGGRSLTIMALDMSNVLDTNYIFQVGYSDAKGVLGTDQQAEAQFLAGSTIGNNPFDNILNSPQQVIQEVAKQQALSPTHAKRTSKIGGLFAIFELLLGVEGHAMGMNLWTTVHERITRLLDMMEADDGRTSGNLFDSAVFDQWLLGSIGNQTPSMSYRQLAQMIMSYIYYDIVPIPTASYFRPGGAKGGRDKFNVIPQAISVPADYEQYFSSGEFDEADKIEPTFLKAGIQIVKDLRAEGYWAIITDGFRNSREAGALYKSAKFKSPHSKGIALDVDGGKALTGLFSGSEGFFRLGNVALSSGRSVTFDKIEYATFVDDYGVAVSRDTNKISTTDARIISFFLNRPSESDTLKKWNLAAPAMQAALFGGVIENIFQWLNYMLIWPLTPAADKAPARDRYRNLATAEPGGEQLIKLWETEWAKGKWVGTVVMGKGYGVGMMLGMPYDDPGFVFIRDWINGDADRKQWFKDHIFDDVDSSMFKIGFSHASGTTSLRPFSGDRATLSRGAGSEIRRSTTNLGGFGDYALFDVLGPKAHGVDEVTIASTYGTVIVDRTVTAKMDTLFAEFYNMKVEFWKSYADKCKNSSHRILSGARTNILGRRRDSDDRFHSPMFRIFGITGDDPVHMQSQQVKDFNPETGLRSYDEAVQQYKSRERMTGFLLRPDIWMCAPPVCNVIFPEEIISLNITRELMKKTTRAFLMTYDTLYADNVIFNGHYFAPKFEDVDNIQQLSFGTSTANEVIYPHETYSGIIPKVSRISEVAFYSRAATVNKEATSLDESIFTSGELAGLSGDAQLAQLETHGTEGISSLVRAYASNVAHYNLLKQRFSSNRISVNAKFLPRLVPGLPAVVIGQKSHSGSVGFRSTHTWLGMIENIQHSVSQGGSTTSIALSTCRPYKTGPNSIDELLKIKKPGSYLFQNQDPEYTKQAIVGEQRAEALSFANEIEIYWGENIEDLWQNPNLTWQEKIVNHIFIEHWDRLSTSYIGGLWTCLDGALNVFDIQQLMQRQVIAATSRGGSGNYPGTKGGWVGLDRDMPGKVIYPTRVGSQNVGFAGNLRKFVRLKKGVQIKAKEGDLRYFSVAGAAWIGDHTDEAGVFLQRETLDERETGPIWYMQLRLSTPMAMAFRVHRDGKSHVGWENSSWRKTPDRTKPHYAELMSSMEREASYIAKQMLNIVTSKGVRIDVGGDKKKAIAEITPDLRKPGYLGVIKLKWTDVSGWIKGSPGDALGEPPDQVTVSALTGTSASDSKFFNECEFWARVNSDRSAEVHVPIYLWAQEYKVKLGEAGGEDDLDTALDMPIPLEEALMPAWLDDSYKNGDVGAKGTIKETTGIGRLYREWFGCDSIVDGVPYGLDGGEYSTVTIESAVSNIIHKYGTSTFNIYKWTNRNIATLSDMLAPVTEDLTNAIPKSGGFHSRSVGNYTQLKGLGLVGTALKGTIAADKKVTIKALTERQREQGLVIDPRQERLKRVKAYKNDIIKQRGKIG